ncbi:MAG: glycoside hydrolase family 97 protein [Chakrabartia sp.]
MPRKYAHMLAAAGLVVLAQPALAEPVATASSPDGNIKVELNIDGDGRVAYSVSRKGKPVLAPSKLGFLFTDVAKLDRHLSLTGQEVKDFDVSWTQPWGEWSSIRNNHRELKVYLKETTALARVFTVTFRIFNDGVGFRYEFPEQPNLPQANIAEELTEFAFASDATAWWKPAFLWNREEYLYNKTPLSAVSNADTPVTMKLADGTHVALHEAALVDYSGMAVARTEGNTLRAVLYPGAGEPKVQKKGAWQTPWRTVIIADDAAGVYQSHIMLNLNEPNKLGDVSYIKPGKFAGVWWNMIKGEWSWARGPKHGATNENVKRYIDFAATNKIPHLLVEGWNVGWDGDWFGNGYDMNFAQPTEDFDVKMLVTYAKKKGVRLIGHHETGGAATHYEKQFDTAFKFAADNNFMVVKTGYVTDAGQMEREDVDGKKFREWHQGQWMVNHQLRVLEAAAKYKIGIDSHEPVKGTGLHRTYPNWVAREGMRGMEYNAWIGGKNPPEHEANVVFTRMLEGPMDFTPGILSLKGSEDSDLLSTIAKQLALYVVIYSPVQMVADTPENYAKYPNEMKFIRDVPTDWSETRVLNGEIGDFVTIARKERGSEGWYVGALGDELEREVSFKLDFLTPGKKYKAEIYRDGDDADYRTDRRHSIIIERKDLTSADSLDMRMAPGGGFAIRIVPAK